MVRAARPGRRAGELGVVRRRQGRRPAAWWGAGRRAGVLLESPTSGKKVPPAVCCGWHGRRNGPGKGRGARGEREEARGRVFSPFRTPERATHLGGFQRTRRRSWRRVAGWRQHATIWRRCWRSREDDGASRSAFYSLERDLVRSSSACGGRGGCGVVRRSRLRQGRGRLSG